MVSRVRWGARWGFKFALGLVAWAIGVFIVVGAAPFESVGASVLAVTMMYLAGGVLGGAVVGLALPWVRSRVGAYVVGVLAGIPFGSMAVGAVTSFRPWSGVEVFALCGGLLTLCGPLGVIYRHMFYVERARRG